MSRLNLPDNYAPSEDFEIISNDKLEQFEVTRMNPITANKYDTDANPVTTFTLMARMYKARNAEQVINVRGTKVIQSVFYAITSDSVKLKDRWSKGEDSYEVETIEGIVGAYSRVKLILKK